MENFEDLVQGLRNAVQLGEERAKANALFLSIGDGILATDQEGRIQQINQVALSILGYDEYEVIGSWFPKIFVAYDDDGNIIDPLERLMTKAIMSGRPISARTNYRTRAGKLIPVFATVSPIIMDGRPIGAVEVFRDISIEHEIDRMKSEFISIASHQLRTPLTSVKTYAHLLAAGFQGPLTEDQQEFMKIILDSVDRMSDLIDILLDVSRIEAGKIELVLRKTRMKHLAEKIITELQPQANKKRLALSLEISPATMTVIIDQVLTTEVITNLIANAIKYTPPNGQIKVLIAHRAQQLLIQVSDTGYGIPQAEQGRIFSKFFRASNASQREPSGSGLGLYMVKKIIETMGGTIRFESDAGRGTTFVVKLPTKLVTASIKQKPLKK